MNVARFRPDGHYIAGASGHNAFLKLYAITSGSWDVTELATGDFHMLPINDIAWSPCGRFIATGGEDCVVVIWRVQINELSKKVQLEPRRVFRGHVAAVTTLAFNFKGTMLASGSVDEKVIVWNVKGGTLFKLLNAHSQPIVSVDFSYDSKLLLTASHDGYLRVWSLVDGMALRILSNAEELLPIRSAKFSPNSVYALVTYTNGLTRLLNLASKSVVKEYGDLTVHSHAELPGAESGEADGTTSNVLDLFSRELAFCRPSHVLVGTSRGIAAYDIKSQRLEAMCTGEPTLCIDINETRRIGLSAGPAGLRLFKLDFA